MIGITVFSHRLIILYALKHFWKHSPHGIFIETISVTRDDALDKQYWISQSGESHDSVTHLINKYVTCTHSAQIRQVSIWWNASGRWQCDDDYIALYVFTGPTFPRLCWPICERQTRWSWSPYQGGTWGGQWQMGGCRCDEWERFPASKLCQQYCHIKGKAMERTC